MKSNLRAQEFVIIANLILWNWNFYWMYKIWRLLEGNG